ncbi:MAG: PrsW family intramembrane metalloprotease [Eubacterium sp.]|nr:PrsW family intramembrane metalloprotease [Eubacterium sp.]
MENLIYILFICVFVPLLVSLPLVQKSSRDVMIFILAGIAVALFISEINGILLQVFKRDTLFVTTTITPATEEIAKAIPVLAYAFLFSDSRLKLLTVSFALGIGFALFENSAILMANLDSVSLGWAVIRGFSTALMHGICTAAIGYGMSYVRLKRKLSIPGTFSLLITAIMYHGIFNILVQSEKLKYYGFILPAMTYVPFVIYLILSHRKAEKKAK